MRKSSCFLIFFSFLTILFLLSLLDAGLRGKQSITRLERTAGLVKELGLTDLALFTEARYTRHPSQADLHSAFQDHPFALEHFPTGSLIQPPPHIFRPENRK